MSGDIRSIISIKWSGRLRREENVKLMDPMCDLVEAHGISKPKGEMWSACHHMKLKDAE
tara:strand:+ start:549 stop:725 length:177 start_codon:yes stop_codon:yes gene_type:complete